MAEQHEGVELDRLHPLPRVEYVGVLHHVSVLDPVPDAFEGIRVGLAGFLDNLVVGLGDIPSKGLNEWDIPSKGLNDFP